MENSNYYSQERNELRRLIDFKYYKVLEIGCGYGEFSKSLSPDAEKWGVEPVSSAAETAEQVFDRFFTAFYDEVADQLPDDYFDLIICNDVIEHMPDPDTFLKKVKIKLSSKGVLCGCVPNVIYYPVLSDLIVKKDWEYQDSGVLDRTHLRFYTQKSLVRALTDSGYKIEMCKLVNKIKWPKLNAWAIKHRLILLAANLLSLGSFNDICYKQIAFRISK